MNNQLNMDAIRNNFVNDTNDTNDTNEANGTDDSDDTNENMNINTIDIIVTIDHVKNRIEYLKENIRDGNIMKIDEYKLAEISTPIIRCKHISNKHDDYYTEFLTFLEIYDTQYKDNYDNVISCIVENRSLEEKKRIHRDNHGNIILLIKPQLHRCYNNVRVCDDITNDTIYKQLLSIKSNITNIFQYETQFSDILDNGNSQKY
jgi:anti-sigma28 factor (negative regulator of flagellin synthesis)